MIEKDLARSYHICEKLQKTLVLNLLSALKTSRLYTVMMSTLLNEQKLLRSSKFGEIERIPFKLLIGTIRVSNPALIIDIGQDSSILLASIFNAF